MRLPPPLSWLWEGWKTFSHVLGRVMSAIILTVLWVVGFGLYGLLRRIGSLWSLPSPARLGHWVPSKASTAESLRRSF